MSPLAAEFQQLAAAPAGGQIGLPISIARIPAGAYRKDLQEFMTYVGIAAPDEAAPGDTGACPGLAPGACEKRALAGSTIRRKLAALSSLFEYLSDANAVTHNPVKERAAAEGRKL